MKSLPLLLAAAIAAAGGLPTASTAADGTLIGGSVESLLVFAREHHPEFAAMRFEADAAAERVAPAGALPDPGFRFELRDFTNEMSGASPSLLPSRVGSAKYTLTQSLPWYGKRDLRREVAAAGADAATQQARATWLELATQIKQVYAQHHVHLYTLRLMGENLDLLQRLGDIAQTRYASGLAQQQDAIRALTERSMLQRDLVMLEGESAQSVVRMRSLLGRPSNAIKLRPPEKLRPLPSAATLDFTALEARLLANNPQLAMAGARITAADKERDLTYRNRYPDVMLGLSPIQTRSRVSEWELMVEVNIPLQQDSRRAQERESERMFEAAKLRRAATRNQALAELGEALAGLEAAQRVETVSTNSLLPQAELMLQSALAGYETGKAEFVMVLEAQRQIRRTRQDIVKARGDQQLRLADIERLIGEEL
ncbi:MAG: TolC family protein [Burkholderiales bacterium]|nr:TolC family protein [Burkholderiales bacterium]